MPFIPLATRRRQEVTLGDRASIDVTLKKQQTWYAQDGDRDRDAAAKYRFARHPNTMTTNVPTEVPFSKSTMQWRPPSADPAGPAAKRMQDSADFGGGWEASHAPKVPRSRSTPSLAKTDMNFARDLMLERFPLTAELKRWEYMGTLMEQRESNVSTKSPGRSGSSVILSSYRPKEDIKVPSAPSGDLVNFPKYLLFNDSHLKQMDIQRYVKEENAARETASQLRKTGSTIGTTSMQTTNASLQTSKGNPLFLRPAGSLMPTGKNSKTSNPFR
eukprot:gnl/MRDRNA2_/MRDRNA2_121104_c0_seq1.p1 gnl/MRDRNA2_/MRDRNA2_121104_c0~~gnl/MRDRNA2_/MRDRNA2_121104_c0_seq1.p1  ORF type:complete len:273 (-),score=36.44 gnl/MRDRNA2_/MRDRNA2_121104_c0_seq1:49-867(-)